MAAVITNLGEVCTRMKNMLGQLIDKENLLRPVALDMIPTLFERIHINGKASDDTDIGEYSSSYLKMRNKKGRMEGKKVVVSFTRQLEEDWTVIATDNGYGIGFINEINFKKARWVEEHFKKTIFSLTESELQEAMKHFEELVNEALNKK